MRQVSNPQQTTRLRQRQSRQIVPVRTSSCPLRAGPPRPIRVGATVTLRSASPTPTGCITGCGSPVRGLTLRACLVALRVPEDQAVALRPRPPPLWTASDAIRRISRLLPGLSEPGPLAAFLPEIGGDGPKRLLRCRVAVASTLFAGLELARNGALVLDQDADWMPIRVTRRDNGDPATSDSAPPA